MEAWPPDDTEESILGTDLHQITIVNLRLGINGAARVGQGARGEPSPWRALTQLEYLGCRRPDGSAHRTYPDLFVFRHAIDPLRGSFSLAVDGLPVLIVEVLSESTYKADMNLERGKGYSYGHVGAAEYLILDPTYAMLPQGIRGWRRVEGVFHAWEPATDGRRYSEQLPIAIALEGALARIYLADGSPMPTEEEIGETLEEQRQALAREREEIERLRRQLGERP